MKTSDSLITLPKIVIVSALLSGCVSTQNGLGIAEISTALSTHQGEQAAIIDGFQQVCLHNGTTPEDWSKLADKNGWQPSEQSMLKDAGLLDLKKTVLSIPGGGGRFDEEQELYSRIDSAEPLTLNLEKRHSKGYTLSSRCEVFGKFEFLRTCEALGNAIGRPPDHNQRYESRNAHFIRWETRVNEMPATISCETAPMSPTLSYDGISLRLQIDHTKQPITIAKRPETNAAGR